MRAAIYLACLLPACGGKATVDLGGNSSRGAGWADTKPSGATPAASASASPETLYDGDFVRALAVDETTIAAAIEDSSGHHIDLCQLADCQATLQTIYEESTLECGDSGSIFPSRFDAVLISHGEVIWAACRNDSIYLAGCSTTGCPDGPRELIHLASGPVALAASADWIYWWQRGPQAKFARCPRADCEVAEIQPFPNELDTLDSNRGSLLVDEPSGTLYASGGAMIAQVPLDFSGGPTAFYQDPVGTDGLAVVGDYIYFTLSSLELPVTHEPGVLSIAVDGPFIYAALQLGASDNGGRSMNAAGTDLVRWRYAEVGISREVLLTGDASFDKCTFMRVFDGEVVWATVNGDLWSCLAEACAATKRQLGIDGDVDHGNSITADEQYIYWLSNRSTPAGIYSDIWNVKRTPRISR
jgi:hypothetical protein